MARGGGRRLNILEYSRPAIRDVQSAARYLAKKTQSGRYGDALASAVADACEQIAATPLIGIEHPEYGLRSFSVRSYRIYYELREGKVEIIRVLHHRRNADRILRRRRRTTE